MTLACIVVMGGCELQPPKGITAFRFDDPREIQSAQLLLPSSDETRGAIRLKFLDTNVFQTTATLAPGRYGLVVRAGEGQYLRTEVEIEAGKRLYRIPPIMANETPAPARGPRLSGQLYVREGKLPGEVAAVFVGHDVLVRRVPVNSDGRFSVEAPAKGAYRVELIAPSSPAWIWTNDRLDLSKDIELKLVVMRRVF